MQEQFHNLCSTRATDTRIKGGPLLAQEGLRSSGAPTPQPMPVVAADRQGRTPLTAAPPPPPITFQEFLKEADLQFLDVMRRGQSLNLADLASDPPPQTLQASCLFPRGVLSWLLLQHMQRPPGKCLTPQKRDCIRSVSMRGAVLAATASHSGPAGKGTPLQLGRKALVIYMTRGHVLLHIPASSAGDLAAFPVLCLHGPPLVSSHFLLRAKCWLPACSAFAAPDSALL